MCGLAARLGVRAVALTLVINVPTPSTEQHLSPPHSAVVLNYAPATTPPRPLLAFGPAATLAFRFWGLRCSIRLPVLLSTKPCKSMLQPQVYVSVSTALHLKQNFVPQFL